MENDSLLELDWSSEVEIDVDDLLSNPFNTQPPSLNQLELLTGFNKQWIMFLYRNFKQRCSNGRMSESQWRGIFRLLFPNAIDYSFADRLFITITAQRGHQQITFEDLVLCLFDLTDSAHSGQHELSTANTTASFAFNLMSPDARGRVDFPSFLSYTRSVFDLCSVRGGSCDNTAQLGLPTGSIHRTKVDEDHPVRPVEPIIQKYAMERFQLLDTDNDGFVTLCDIEREFADYGESVALKSLRELDELLEIENKKEIEK